MVAAYFVGAVPAAYLAVKWVYGVDIRDYGSGKVGVSNVFRSFSRWLGVGVGAYDVCKGALMVWIAQLLGFGIPEQTAVGLIAIIGHSWSVFMHFNAGRGVATALGVACVLWHWGLPVFFVIAAITAITGGSAIPVLVGVAIMPLVSWLMGEPLSLTLGLLSLFVLLMIRRLTAPREDKSASIRTGELLLARFLFDRDTFKQKDLKIHGAADAGGPKYSGRPQKGE